MNIITINQTVRTCAIAAAIAACFCTGTRAHAQGLLLAAGQSGRNVQIWQTFLANEGLCRLPADGNFDNRTVAGTMYFQAQHGLLRTGSVDSSTLAAAQQDIQRASQQRAYNAVPQYNNNYQSYQAQPSYNMPQNNGYQYYQAQPAYPQYFAPTAPQSHQGMDWSPSTGCYLPHNPYSGSGNSYEQTWVNQFKNPYSN